MKCARVPIFSAALLGISSPALASETLNYTYDAKGRLVKVERSGTVNNGVKTEYSHDRADNRQNVKVTGSSDPASPSCNLAITATYSASSNYNGYTGLSGSGMRDAVYTGLSSVHGTAQADTTPWIMMELGLAQTVGSVIVVPISSSYGGWGPVYLDGAVLQRSTDAANWTNVTTVSGTADDTKTTINVGAMARYLRLTKTQAWLAVGDFCLLQ